MVSIEAAESEAKYAEIQAQLDQARDNVVKCKRLYKVIELAGNGPNMLSHIEREITSYDNDLKGADQTPELIIK
jgi:hypothetical protein